MNIYDTVNKLSYELRNSNEYLEYKRLKQEVKNNPTLQEKLDEFEKARYNIQLASIQGTDANEEQARKMQELYLELLKDEIMKKYFDAELKFNVLLTDINKIIGESVQDVLK